MNWSGFWVDEGEEGGEADGGKAPEVVEGDRSQTPPWDEFVLAGNLFAMCRLAFGKTYLRQFSLNGTTKDYLESLYRLENI